ncbi:unnamed protein product, partial [marine sediment metagenome]
SHELWLKNPRLLQHYQERFRHILVDEFQDTNTIQYAWVKMLAGDAGTVMIVGDDDQSIYGWRGAKIENLHRFERDYSDTKTIRLEQNYRSTATILKASNALIANNADRLGKSLWTEGNEGEPISVYAAFNEIDESRFIVSRIEDWLRIGNKRSDVAILYRSNAQSRVLEETLLRAGMPYLVYGGFRFFDRAEIKDVMAYLRLTNNRDDDTAFERVVNTPTRGIGNKTISEVRLIARERQLSLWQAAKEIIQDKSLSLRAHNALTAFLTLLDEISNA